MKTRLMVQVVITLVLFLIFSIPFPIIAWNALARLFHGIGFVTGYQAQLVGEPGSIDPGAVIVTALYLLLNAIIVKVLIKPLPVSAWILGIGSLIFLPYVFAKVSSTIWF